MPAGPIAGNSVNLRSLPTDMQYTALAAKNWVGNQSDVSPPDVITASEVSRYFKDKFSTEAAPDGTLQLSAVGKSNVAQGMDDGAKAEALYDTVVLGQAPQKPEKEHHGLFSGITFPWDNLDDGGGGFHWDLGFHD